MIFHSECTRPTKPLIRLAQLKALEEYEKENKSDPFATHRAWTHMNNDVAKPRIFYNDKNKIAIDTIYGKGARA